MAFAFVIVKVMFGTKAPAESLTVPSMLPVVSWAKAAVEWMALAAIGMARKAHERSSSDFFTRYTPDRMN